jgi:hypothetical protein
MGANDVRVVMEAITGMQSDLNATAETVQSTAVRLQQNTITQQQVAILSQETEQALKEAGETSRTTTNLLQETNEIAKSDERHCEGDSVHAVSQGFIRIDIEYQCRAPSRLFTISTQTSSLFKLYVRSS